MKAETYHERLDRRERREVQRLQAKIRFRHMSIARYEAEIVELEAELESRTGARSPDEGQIEAIQTPVEAS